MRRPDPCIQTPSLKTLWDGVISLYLHGLQFYLKTIEGYIVSRRRPAHEVMASLNDLARRHAAGEDVVVSDVIGGTGEDLVVLAADKWRNAWLLWYDQDVTECVLGILGEPKKGARDPRLGLFKRYCASMSMDDIAYRVFVDNRFCWIPTLTVTEREAGKGA